MSDERGNVERLTNLAGFDPAKAPKITRGLFQEVMDDLTKERSDKAKEKARGLITKAIELRE